MWIEKEKVYFEVVEIISIGDNHLKKEKGKNIFSIKEKDLITIRCKLYFIS